MTVAEGGGPGRGGSDQDSAASRRADPFPECEIENREWELEMPDSPSPHIPCSHSLLPVSHSGSTPTARDALESWSDPASCVLVGPDRNYLVARRPSLASLQQRKPTS